MKEVSIAKRLIQVIASALFVQLLICYPLWIPSFRAFPVVPLIPKVNVHWGTALNWLFYLSMLGACIALFKKPFSKTAYITLATLFALLVLEDINRLQPWFYLYLIMLSPLVFAEKMSPAYLLNIFRIVLASVYFWSGLQKLNVHFAVEVFPWIAEFIGAASFIDKHHFISYMAAGCEALSGILLWVPRLRKLGASIAMGMHLCILISLGPWAHNWNAIVWPWNIAFAWMVFELFYRSNPTPIQLKKSSIKYHMVFVLWLVSIMPAFGLMGKWDHFLSDGFYSAMLNEPAFYFPLSESDRLPNSSLPEQYYLEKQKKAILLINYWALDELKVPMYPEDRVYREVARKLSASIADYDSTGLRVTFKKRFEAKLREVGYSYSNLAQVP
jgi:uncharacterized membrane protein YphA (DoxX/SURF4 family)